MKIQDVPTQILIDIGLELDKKITSRNSLTAKIFKQLYGYDYIHDCEKLVLFYLDCFAELAKRI